MDYSKDLFHVKQHRISQLSSTTSYEMPGVVNRAMSNSVEQSVEQILDIQCMISDDEMHIRNDLYSTCNIGVLQCYIRVTYLDLLLIVIINNHRIGNSEPR